MASIFLQKQKQFPRVRTLFLAHVALANFNSASYVLLPVSNKLRRKRRRMGTGTCFTCPTGPETFRRLLDRMGGVDGVGAKINLQLNYKLPLRCLDFHSDPVQCSIMLSYAISLASSMQVDRLVLCPLMDTPKGQMIDQYTLAMFSKHVSLSSETA